MRIAVAGRDIELRIDHFFVVFSALMLVAISATAVIAAVSFATEGSLNEDSLIGWTFAFSDILVAIGAPLFAFLFLSFAGIIKLKKDAGLCRSLAAANAVLSFAISSVASIMVFVMLQVEIPAPFFITLAGDMLFTAAGAIMLYLWLLIALKPDMKRANEVAGLSAAFAIVLLVAWKAFLALSGYVAGIQEQIAFEPNDLMGLVSYFVFAFPLFYQVAGAKIKKNDAAFFAALYMGASILFTISYYVQSGNLDSIYIGIVDPVLRLSLIYILANKDTLKTF